jgi:hypothetical protein
MGFEREERSEVVTIASECEAYAYYEGKERPERAWILSDYDTWHRNPFYRGPPVPHPDDEPGR